jgi:hypothetical protein
MEAQSHRDIQEEHSGGEYPVLYYRADRCVKLPGIYPEKDGGRRENECRLE